MEEVAQNFHINSVLNKTVIDDVTLLQNGH